MFSSQKYVAWDWMVPAGLSDLGWSMGPLPDTALLWGSSSLESEAPSVIRDMPPGPASCLCSHEPGHGVECGRSCFSQNTCPQDLSLSQPDVDIQLCKQAPVPVLADQKGTFRDVPLRPTQQDLRNHEKGSSTECTQQRVQTVHLRAFACFLST